MVEFAWIGVAILATVLKILYSIFKKKQNHNISDTQRNYNTPNFEIIGGLVTLPTGEAINIDNIVGIKITGDSLYNVCIVRDYGRVSSQISFYSTYSRKKAEKMSRLVTKAINEAKFYKENKNKIIDN